MLSTHPTIGAWRQRGLSLIELMVGIAIGMIVVAGASLLMTNQVKEHSKLMQETQIQQDLRATADLMLRDLKRSGYWSRPEGAVWASDMNVAANPYAGASASAANELTYAYSTVNASNGLIENDSRDATDSYGFRRDPEQHILQSLVGGHWQPLTDPSVLLIQAFTVTPVQQVVALAGYCDQVCNPTAQTCPTLVVTRFEITITGRSARDEQVVRTIRVVSRPRNDEVNGACPAPASPAPPVVPAP